LAPLGIKVTVVEPGYFRTEFLAGNSAVYASKIIALCGGCGGRHCYGEARVLLRADSLTPAKFRLRQSTPLYSPMIRAFSSAL